jgi:predicted RNA-binding Zn-ribbon protein involved in translation (DUF1610 family)
VKTLIYDLEVSPILGWNYEKYESNMVAMEHDYFLLSVAYKWLGEKQVHVLALPDYKTYKKDRYDDKELVKDFHKVLSEAQIVIGHNMARFDERKVNARMVLNGLDCPSHRQVIDTLRVARSKFAFTSNKLADLAEYLQIPQGKMHVDSAQWIKAIHGDMKTWDHIKKYNKRDIEVTEQVYLKLRSYMTNHPNMNIDSNDPFACPTCGHDDLIKRGPRITKSGYKHHYQCKGCGSYCSTRTSTITTELIP